MRLKLLAFVLAGLTFTGCKDDDKVGTLVMTFTPVYGGEPLATFQTKPFDQGQQLQFTHLSMLVSDLILLRSASERQLREIELVDLSFDSPAEAAEGHVVTITDVPEGSYTGLRFGVGVPPDLNEKKPADFPSGNPLSNSGYYWVPWSSYIFSKIEGRLDTLGNGVFDLGFALHTGADPLYRIIEWEVPLNIEDGQTKAIEIRIDFQSLLEGVDIKSNPQNHNPQDTVQILQIVNHLASAMTLVQ